jgi:GntR family transcriptional regulator
MSNPMYRQIAEDLREQIESGRLQPSHQLQTELELREHYGASRNTVRDAIKWLTTLGLVETRPGQGTFVVRKIDPYITELTADSRGLGDNAVSRFGEIEKSGAKREILSSTPQVEIQKASTAIAAQLQIAEGSQIISRHQKRFIDDTPWSLQTSFYPMGFVLKGADRLLLADNIETGTVTYLAETLGLREVAYRDLITVRTPDVTEAVFFGVPQNGSVGMFEISRTGFDQTGTPIRLTVGVFPTDRNQFIINVENTLKTQPRAT